MVKRVFLIAAGIFLALPVAAACRLNLTLPQEIKLESQGMTQSSLMIGNGGNAACNFFVTFSEKSSRGRRRQLTDGQSVYPYEIYADAGRASVLRDLPQAGAAEVLGGTIAAVQKFSTLTFFVELPADVSARAGLYTDRLEVSVYEGTPQGDRRFLQSKNLRLVYEVPQEVRLSLVEEGAAFTGNDVEQLLDFGILNKGETRAFDVVIKANTDFDLFFLSANRGRMKHAERNEFVDYRFALNGVSYNLSNELKNSRGFDQSAKGFYRNGVRITIGDVQDHSAGRYEDDITVTVVAK